MKSTTVIAAYPTDIFDDDWEPQTFPVLGLPPGFNTGNLVSTGISCIFKTGQPAASHKNHLGNIYLNPKNKLACPIGESMETN
ncbi:MAG: hypothetical protein LBB26_02835 [Puniceicoccales bacterium]|jgi:hypothetical protein|nr:hypothetical protein [Puniceicoccales bacterium]